MWINPLATSKAIHQNDQIHGRKLKTIVLFDIV